MSDPKPSLADRLARALAPRGDVTSPEAARAKLEARARTLARPPKEEAHGEEVELVLFSLASETYALEARLVREVARFREFAVVPFAPEALVGVTNLRGEVMPVYDLRPLLGVPRNRLTDLARAIVLERDGDVLAVLADQALDVVRVPRSAVLPPETLPPGTERAIVSGVTAQAVIVLDGQALLGDPRFLPKPAREA